MKHSRRSIETMIFSADEIRTLVTEAVKLRLSIRGVELGPNQKLQVEVGPLDFDAQAVATLITEDDLEGDERG